MMIRLPNGIMATFNSRGKKTPDKNKNLDEFDVSHF